MQQQTLKTGVLDNVLRWTSYCLQILYMLLYVIKGNVSTSPRPITLPCIAEWVPNYCVHSTNTRNSIDKLVLVVYDEELAVKGNIKDYIKC